MSVPSNMQSGICFGEKMAPTSAANIVDGLTSSRYVLVKPMSTNPGDVLITSAKGAGTGSGFRLKPTDPPVLLDLGYDNSSLLFTSSAPGSTLGYIGVNGTGY